MKLALVCEHFNPEGGGAERSADQIAQELTRRGHKVTILALRAPREVSTPHAQVEVCAPRHIEGMIKRWQFAQAVRKRLDSGQYDASISFSPIAPGTILQPRSGVIRQMQRRAVRAKSPGPARLYKQVTLALSPKAALLRRLERQAMSDPRVTHYVAISQTMRQQLTEHYRIDPDRISVIPNAASMPRVLPRQRQQWRRQIRQRLNIPDHAVGLLFCSMDPQRKGLAPLLAAFKRWIDEHVASDGPGNGVSETAHLKTSSTPASGYKGSAATGPGAGARATSPEPAVGLAGDGGPPGSPTRELSGAGTDELPGAGARESSEAGADELPGAGAVVLMLVGLLPHKFVQRIASMGLRPYVRVMGQTQQMPAVYSAADATVLPSFYDPASKVVIESLMMGVPAITTRHNGACDMVHPEDRPARGVVLDEADEVDALAQALHQMIDPAQRRKFSLACAGLADQLSMRRHVDALEKLLTPDRP